MSNLDLLDLFAAAEAGDENAELALLEQFVDEDIDSYELVSEQDGVAPFVECELPEALSEEEYISIADELLCFTIREAFGVSRGGAEYRTDTKSSLMAWDWIVSTSTLDAGYPFSFENCCRAAGVDPLELRETLISQRSGQFGKADGMSGAQLSF